ncbi:MAG: S9 family peptidase [Candidatus Marinimicrobia bacterium]|nr:S9 family peptidase [Candidatus Neomarinimicrobiota bacterium]
MSCTPTQKSITYPPTRTVDQIDDYFGTQVSDPYRWLEDLDSEEVLNWAHSQQDVTQKYLNKIPFTNKIEDLLKSKWDYERMGRPFHRENRYFYYHNTGLQNHSMLYFKDGLDGDPRVLLDPNLFSGDGSKSLSMVSVSKDGNSLAYGISQSGSDWDEYFIMDVVSGKHYDDHLKWIKFSKASWLPDGSGFYYGRYPEPKGDEFEVQNQNNKLYLHRIGTSQNEDELIYEDPENPDYGFSSWITTDEKYQILGAWSGANDHILLFYRDFGSKNDFIPIVSEWKGDFNIIHNFGSEFYVFTRFESPNGRVMKFDLSNPEFSTWEDVIPESDDILSEVRIVNRNQLLTTFRKDLIDEVKIFSVDGTFIYDIQLPDMGSVGFSAQWDDTEIFYNFSSFLYPSTIFTLNLNTRKSELYWRPNLNFDASNFTLKREFYESKDGTRIPMFIVHKSELKLDGQNPTYLYGYGGFNGSVTPYFSVSRLTWLELGGVLALPAIRGGGEYGEDWHEAGMLNQKQNVFDDFIAAGEFLINTGYTSSEKLAIGGGSNGGLLVSACMLQRPDLFTVIDCSVPVTDMLRFHKFTIGWAWVPEYGSSEDKAQFQTLIQYSPVHNVKKGENYPSIIISTGDHDDRVVPSHSYKLAAELQRKNGGTNPMLLRVHGKSGHGEGKPTNQVIREIAETWAFILNEMGEIR